MFVYVKVNKICNINFLFVIEELMGFFFWGGFFFENVKFDNLNNF